MTTVFLPEAIYRRGALEFGASLAVGDDGQVLATTPAGAQRVELAGRVLLPGLVNAHSHAFQRVLRGRTEFRDGERDDFWSWRELMYAAATSLGPEALFTVSRQAFLEMALAGITSVGEFHSLHHQPDGTPYADEHELALQVIRAATEVGLRITLLRVAYARAGFGVEPNRRQRRFLDADVDVCLRRAGDLRARVKHPLVTVGLAPHSVRALPRAWLEQLAAQWRDGPVHMHLSEQPAEVEACLAEHGLRPVELAQACGLLGPRFTAVHAIHLAPNEVDQLGASASTVCACPSTERNLGDGVVPADALLRAGAGICLGSDSQAHIDVLEDARQLEGHLRLVRGRRNVLDGLGTGPRASALAARLVDSATAAGARSLGLPVGELEAGRPADFCAVDVTTPGLAGLPREALLAGVVLAGAPVREVAVNGRLLVRAGQHADAVGITADFVQVMRRLVAQA
jgi:formimidoylglutamate deiminase